MSNLYRHADAGLKRIYKIIEHVFQNSALATWDELNVFRKSEEIYTQIDEFARQQFQEIAEKAYEDAKKEILAVLPEKKDKLIGLGALFLGAILASYSGKTKYRYDREWERKKDRLAESVMAVVQASASAKVINSNELREELGRAMRLMQGQVREMADTMTDEARNEAFEQAGIDKVQWHTQKDSKVCKECQERDEKIYDIYSVPDKHHRCRCYLTAVIQ